jgi:hypothetical protein
MVIRIQHGKGRRDRDVPMTPLVLEVLRRYWLHAKPTVYLFPSPCNANELEKPISPKTVWNAVHKAAVRAGLTKRIGPHTLRCFVVLRISLPIGPFHLSFECINPVFIGFDLFFGIGLIFLPLCTVVSFCVFQLLIGSLNFLFWCFFTAREKYSCHTSYDSEGEYFVFHGSPLDTIFRIAA